MTVFVFGVYLVQIMQVIGWENYMNSFVKLLHSECQLPSHFTNQTNWDAIFHFIKRRQALHTNQTVFQN
jgi:hypothetical protein